MFLSMIRDLEKYVKNINIHKLSKLSFQKVNSNQFPSVNLIEKSLKYGLLTPTIINAANEVLVDLFLSNKICFLDYLFLKIACGFMCNF